MQERRNLHRLYVAALMPLAGCEAAVADPMPEDQSSALASDGIVVTAPANGATVASPVAIHATVATCSGAKVTAFGYSVDNDTAMTWGSPTSIDASDARVSAGAHTLHFKAWSNGILCPVVSRTITVSTAGKGYDGSTLIPVPPSGATLFADVDDLTGWSAATGAASSCPNGKPSPTCNPPDASFNRTVLHVSDPARVPPGGNGSAGLFELYNGPGWATCIWGHGIGSSTSARRFIWDFSVYVTGTDYGSSELDFYQILSGHRFMLGTQCNRTKNSWDTWNEATQVWRRHTDIPCDQILTPNRWHRVIMYLSTDASSNTYTYHALRIDGVDYGLNETEPAQPSIWPNGHIGVQVQLDANGHGTGVNEYIDAMRVLAW